VACASADASPPKRAARGKKPGAQPGGAATKRSADDGASVSSMRKKAAAAAPAGAERAAPATVLQQLSAEQRLVLELVERRENVFITGSAGVGKSFTLNQVIAALKRRYGAVRDR
jgi:predicted ATP-dependent serine protease